MKRWRAKLILWLHGYCLKHGCPKELYGHDPESAYYQCPKCEDEHDQRVAQRLATAKQVLGIEDHSNG